MKKPHNFFRILSAIFITIFFAINSFHALASTDLLSSNLSRGSHGTAVSALQTFLATNSLIYPQRLVTGVYGPSTSEAVSQFQIAYGLPVTGSVDTNTRIKINMLAALHPILDTSAPIISSLSETQVSSTPLVTTRPILTWTTDEPTSSYVFYATAPIKVYELDSYGAGPVIVNASMVTDKTLLTTHTIELSHLTSQTSYYYLVVSHDETGNTTVANGVFTTK